MSVSDLGSSKSFPSSIVQLSIKLNTQLYNFDLSKMNFNEFVSKCECKYRDAESSILSIVVQSASEYLIV